MSDIYLGDFTFTEEETGEIVQPDDSKEIKYAVDKMGGLHDHSQQYRSETNGMIERCVQKINEGTSAVRGQSGLAEAWWPYAMRFFCFMSNVLDILIDGKTSYENRWGRKFGGPLYPFGCEVDYHAIGPDKDRCSQFGTKTLPGFFLGMCRSRTEEIGKMIFLWC